MSDADVPEPHPRMAFLTGASGFVGSRLVDRLLQTGWTVRALVRNERAGVVLRERGAVPVMGDLTDAASLRAGLVGVDTVFHVAAHFKLWGDRALFDRVNVEGTRVLVDAARTAPSVRRVVAVSAAAVVMGDPEPMLGADEQLPLQDRSFAPYASSKAEGERVLLGANASRPGFETIAVRPPMIWGAGMPALDHMVDTVRKGRWQWVAGGDQPMSVCHVDNLCDALILAAERGRGGESYFVADAQDGTLKSVIGDLLTTRGVDPGDKSVPFGTAWTLAGLMAFVWRTFGLAGEPPLTRQMLRLIGQPFTISTGKARRDLGYSPRVTWREGLAAMRGGDASAGVTFS